MAKVTFHREFKLSVEQIRTAWAMIQDGQNPLSRKQAALRHHVESSWRGDRVDPWVGVSGNQMNVMLDKGYEVEGDPSLQFPGASEIQTPFMDWAEEDGDLVIEAALGGEDLPYVRWEDFEAKKGITIRACFDFNAGTPAKVIHDYFAWLLKCIDAAQRQGVSPAVELWIATKGSYVERKNDTYKILIPLCKSGDVVDVTSWRAFLHGGAFRTLGFLALGLIGDELGYTLTSGLGSAVGVGWDADYDEATGVLNIDAPGHASVFPEDEMTRKARVALSNL